MNTRRLLRYLLLVALIAIPSMMLGKKSTFNQLEHHDFIYLSPSAGYQALIDTTESSAMCKGLASGGAFQLGAGYRMYHNHFLLTAGLNLKFGEYRVNGNNLNVSLPGMGTLDIMAHYDLIHAGEVQVPIMIGAEMRRFYFLLGPKIGLRFYSDEMPYARVETNPAKEEVPVVQNKSTESFAYIYNLNAAFEMGWRLGEVFYGHGADIPKPTTRYYLGVFAEGGALSRKIAESHDPYYEHTTIEGADGLPTNAVGLYPIYGLSDFKNTQFVHNFTVGVKFTVLFELNPNKYCAICKDHKKENFSW